MFIPSCFQNSLFILVFCQFHFDIRAEDRFRLHLKGVLCTFWISMPFSFPRLGKFSAMICSSTPSAPFSFSSSSGISIIWILLHFIASLSSLILPSYSWNFYSSFSQLPLFPLIVSSNSPILSSTTSVCAMATCILFCTSFIAFFSSS